MSLSSQAHALAVQTGTEILVKMHDSHDISGCQYYGTSNLKHIYRNTKLVQPGETLVSGETGLPLMDKCIQYGEDASASTESSVPDEVQGGGGGGGDLQSSFQGQGMGANPSAVPMQLSSADFSNFNSQTQTQGNANDDDSDIEITQITNPQNLMAQSVQVKQEPSYEQQQQNPMFGQQQQQIGDQSMMGNQGMMGNQSVLGNYQAPIAPKPYQCSICRKAFKSVHVLQKHTLTFHTPGGGGSSLKSRGRGRGSRGRGRGGTRGRGLKLTISRTHVGGSQQQQYQAMPSIKTEGSAPPGGGDPNRFVLAFLCFSICDVIK